ncbi:CubicO group peptidase, beta-lactamase class C family [Ensifer adhaerens]|nr:CubicO group peptidase, beta-lactamase class C family [Ensifer adhaerens]
MNGEGILMSTRLGRFLRLRGVSNHDHLLLPSVALAAAEKPLPLPRSDKDVTFGAITTLGPKGTHETALESLLVDTGTTALVAVRDGSIVYEFYGNGGARETVNRCFSVTKSFTSALVGCAISEGLFAGLDETVGALLPALSGSPAGALTLRHLLEMRSGLRFVEGVMPWSDDAIVYLSPDCRAAALRAPVSDPVGAYFHYNDYHLMIVGMMLEKATGEPLQRYFERKLWQPIGAENRASLTVDSTAAGFAHMESGLNATAVDLAKFGQMFLDGGMVGGRQVVPADWVASSTGATGARRDPDWFRYYNGKPWGRVFASGKVFYKHFWWGYQHGDIDDFFAMGALGQHIYVSPKDRTVIVRLSERFPPGCWWPPIFRQIIEQM